MREKGVGLESAVEGRVGDEDVEDISRKLASLKQMNSLKREYTEREATTWNGIFKKCPLGIKVPTKEGRFLSQTSFLFPHSLTLMSHHYGAILGPPLLTHYTLLSC